MASKNVSTTGVEKWKFDMLDLPQDWKDHLGDLPKNFRIHIVGEAKNGKTEYFFQFADVLCESGLKLNFNSTEQLKTLGLQRVFLRNNMGRHKGKFILADRSQKSFEVWFERLERSNSGHVIALDSTNYMNLTFKQWSKLNDRFPNKAFILISWDRNPLAKQLEFMMDAIVVVKNFEAKVVSRVGGGKVWPVWPERIQQLKQLKGGKAKPADQPQLF